MSVYFRLALDAIIADDADFRRQIYADQQSLLDGSTFALGAGRPLDIDHTNTETIDLQQIATGGLLVIRSDRQVKIKLTNGAEVDQAITIGTALDKPGILVLLGVWTGLKIENQSGQTAHVLVGFAGNKA